MSTQLGHPGLTEQPTEREYIPAQGWQTVREWHGSEAAVDGFSSQLVQFGYRLRRFRVEGIIYGLEAQIPDAQDGSAPPVDPDDDQLVTWELVGNDLNKSIFDHDNFSDVTSVTAADQQTLRDIRDGTTKHTEAAATDLTGNAEKFRVLLSKGVQSFPISQYVLRKTSTVPLNWAGQQAMTNVGDVYTSTSQMETAEGVPNDLKFIMPEGKWLKRTPTIRQQRSGRWQINSEFWHADDASDVLYDEVT
jgi:hypothetical protein